MAEAKEMPQLEELAHATEEGMAGLKCCGKDSKPNLHNVLDMVFALYFLPLQVDYGVTG